MKKVMAKVSRVLAMSITLGFSLFWGVRGGEEGGHRWVRCKHSGRGESHCVDVDQLCRLC